jgi:hypothetical protein
MIGNENPGDRIRQKIEEKQKSEEVEINQKKSEAKSLFYVVWLQ